MRYEDTLIQRSRCFGEGHHNRGHTRLSNYYSTFLYALSSTQEIYACLYVTNAPCIICDRCGARIVSATTRALIDRSKLYALAANLNLQNSQCVILDYQFIHLPISEQIKVAVIYDEATDDFMTTLDAHGEPRNNYPF